MSYNYYSDWGFGEVTLASGTATVTDALIDPTTFVVISPESTTGHSGVLSVELLSGSFKIHSSDATDSRVVKYEFWKR